MDETPIIDQTALIRLERLGGGKLVVQMVRLYLENAAERLSQIDDGLSDGGSLDSAAGGAHSLKSSAANVGATRVRALAAAMEEAATAGRADEVRTLRSRLGPALDEAKERLDTLTEGMS